MATSRPTFANKVDRQTQAGERINLVIADDINQLKAGIIALYEMLATVKVRTCVPVVAADFTGPYYDNSKLVNLTPDVDFRIFTNSGSGTLLRYLDGYTFTAATGRVIGLTPDYYSIEIYQPVTEL